MLLSGFFDVCIKAAIRSLECGREIGKFLKELVKTNDPDATNHVMEISAAMSAVCSIFQE